MKSIFLAVAVAFLLCGSGSMGVQAAEGLSERPFGGPPPPRGGDRGLKGKGFICRTAAAATCRLTASQPVGSACSCPRDGGGSEPGKVER